MSLASELRYYAGLVDRDARVTRRKSTARIAAMLRALADEAERKAARERDKKRRQRARRRGDDVPPVHGGDATRSRQLRQGQDGEWNATHRTDKTVTLRRADA